MVLQSETELHPVDSKRVDGEQIPLLQDKSSGQVNDSQPLNRSLSFWDGFAFMVGLVLGSGIFVSPGLVAAGSPDMFIALLAWILCGIFATLGASCFCEMASIFPKTGSTYTYIREIYGDLLGFVYVWTRVLIVAPCGSVVIAYSAGSYIVRLMFEDGQTASSVWTAKAIALFFILSLVLLNGVGVKEFGRVQMIFSACQVFIVALLICLGVWQLISTKNVDNFKVEVLFNNTSTLQTWQGIKGFGLALYAALWASDGWYCVPFLVEEIRNPSRNIPLVTFTSLPFITFIYVSLNLAFIAALTKDEIGMSETVGITMAKKVVGEKFAYLMPILVAVCCLGTLNTEIYIAGRTQLSAAREGHLPEFLSWIHKKRRTPVLALTLYSVITFLWLLFGDSISTFINCFNFALWSYHLLVFVGILYLRYSQPDLHRPYRVCTASPVLLILFSAPITVLGFAISPVGSGICVLVMLSTVPFYYFFFRRTSDQSQFGFLIKFRSWLSDSCDLVPCEFDGSDVVCL